MDKRCHACNAVWEERHEPGRNETCLRCGTVLHCCVNCRFYDAKTSDWCREPAASRERPRDPRCANSCEWYQMGAPEPSGKGGEPAASAGTAEERKRLEAVFGPPPKRDAKPPDWA